MTARGEHRELDLRAISRAALVTAAALALPIVFHAVQLGRVFLPVFQPLLVGAFFLPVGWAAAAGVAAPLLSGALTGMPPFFPPVAFWMAAELGLIGALVAALGKGGRRSLAGSAAVVALALVVGRVVYLALTYLTGRWLELPAGLLTLASLLTSWPGVLLALVAVPFAVAGLARAGVER